MTEEHLPQRSVGNNGETSAYIHLTSKPDSEPIGTWSDGHSAPTLCGPCNGRPSKLGYVGEFKLWHEFVVAQLRRYVAIHGTDPMAKQSLSIEVPYDRMPGRFVRQVIGNLLAMQDTPQLTETYPMLAELIGSDPDDDRKAHPPVDISPLQLHFGLANRNTLMNRSPILMAVTEIGSDVQSQPWSSRTSMGMVVTYVVSPFAFVLSDCPVIGIEGLRIDKWARMGIHERLPKDERHLDVPTLLSGWTGPLAELMSAGGGE